jgi:hypothetical protein
MGAGPPPAGAANGPRAASAETITSSPDFVAVSSGYGPVPPICVSQSGKKVETTGPLLAAMAYAVGRVLRWGPPST